VTTMIADDALLLAYVDGELTPQQCQEIEQLMEVSPEVAKRVSNLMASCLPYHEAFAHQAIPAVPDSLLEKIEVLSKQSIRPLRSEEATLERTAERTSRNAGLVSRLFAQSRPRMGWMAVAFASGAMCCMLVLQTGFPGAGLKSSSLQQAPAVAQVQPSPWVRQAAGYQQLYTRDTVNLVVPDAAVVAKTVRDIRQIDGLSLRIPDLSSAGLTFKGVQRLSFDKKALVQLIYLPENGAPVALCVMKEPKPDSAPSQMRVSQMSVVVWRQSELGYALIGEPGGVDLNAIARLVADRRAGQLFAAKAAPLWIVDIR
jgi:anti-sigma factor RsiW